MLEFCVKQNVFLYAMIAAGIAGVWCLFWNNRFYTRAIRDLGRLKEPKSKWTRSVLETCQKKAHPFSNAGAFMRSQIAQGRSAGMAVPTLLRGSQNMILTVLALSILSLWAIYRYRYGEAELMRYLGTGIALAGGLVFFRLCLDFGGKEEILLNGWTDYLENEFAATKQSAVLETVQQTAKKRAALLQGQTHSALVEDVNDQDPELLTGRLSNNMIVHFKGEKDLIGQIVPVCLKECHGFYYLGERV